MTLEVTQNHLGPLTASRDELRLTTIYEYRQTIKVGDDEAARFPGGADALHKLVREDLRSHVLSDFNVPAELRRARENMSRHWENQLTILLFAAGLDGPVIDQIIRGVKDGEPR